MTRVHWPFDAAFLCFVGVSQNTHTNDTFDERKLSFYTAAELFKCMISVHTHHKFKCLSKPGKMISDHVVTRKMKFVTKLERACVRARGTYLFLYI